MNLFQLLRHNPGDCIYKRGQSLRMCLTNGSERTTRSSFQLHMDIKMPKLGLWNWKHHNMLFVDFPVLIH